MARRLVASLLVVCAIASTTSPARAESTEGYRPPVDAPVSDPFRPATSPYGPANLGLEYEVTNRTAVRASASGVVVFAGRVARVGFVTVQHGDGLRTTYGNLVRIDVRRGDIVGQGDVVGRSGTWTHFSVRDGERYLDPATVFGRVQIDLRLVPHDDPLLDASALRLLEQSEYENLIELWGSGGGGLFGDLVDLVSDGADLVLEAPGRAWDSRWWYLQLAEFSPQVDLTIWLYHVGEVAFGPQPPCTDGSIAVEPPTERRIAIEVGGLGSEGGGGSIVNLDTATLGYADEDVVQYSYDGGAVEGPGQWQEALSHSDYDAGHTYQDITVSAQLLRELIHEVSEANPGVPVDLYAHSQGGLVAQYALSGEGHAYIDGQVASVVTYSSPHQGADGATLVDFLGSNAVGDHIVHIAEGVRSTGLTETSVGQLSEQSDFIASLEPFPPGVDALTVSARGDYVVNAGQSVVAGTRHVVITAGFNAHSNVVGDADATRATLLHLAGLAQACRGRIDGIIDVTIEDAYENIVGSLGLG